MRVSKLPPRSRFRKSNPASDETFHQKVSIPGPVSWVSTQDSVLSPMLPLWPAFTPSWVTLVCANQIVWPPVVHVRLVASSASGKVRPEAADGRKNPMLKITTETETTFFIRQTQGNGFWRAPLLRARAVGSQLLPGRGDVAAVNVKPRQALVEVELETAVQFGRVDHVRAAEVQITAATAVKLQGSVGCVEGSL